MLEIISMMLGPVQTNSYIVADPRTKDAVVIDPADEGLRILDEAYGLPTLTSIILREQPRSLMDPVRLRPWLCIHKITHYGELRGELCSLV